MSYLGYQKKGPPALAVKVGSAAAGWFDGLHFTGEGAMQRTRKAVTGLGGRAGVVVCWLVLMVLLLAGGRPSIATADCATQIQIPESECNALMALYTATNGPGWTNNTGWDVPENPCEFYGVSCSGGHVTWLNLMDS